MYKPTWYSVTDIKISKLSVKFIFKHFETIKNKKITEVIIIKSHKTKWISKHISKNLVLSFHSVINT